MLSACLRFGLRRTVSFLAAKKNIYQNMHVPEALAQVRFSAGLS